MAYRHDFPWVLGISPPLILIDERAGAISTKILLNLSFLTGAGGRGGRGIRKFYLGENERLATELGGMLLTWVSQRLVQAEIRRAKE